MVICDVCQNITHLDQVYIVYTQDTQGKLIQACETCYIEIETKTHKKEEEEDDEL